MPEKTRNSYYDNFDNNIKNYNINNDNIIYKCNNKNINNQYLLMSPNIEGTTIIPTN